MALQLRPEFGGCVTKHLVDEGTLGSVFHYIRADPQSRARFGSYTVETMSCVLIRHIARSAARFDWYRVPRACELCRADNDQVILRATP